MHMVINGNTIRFGCSDRTLQLVIIKGYRPMHGDVILVGKFVQIINCNVRSGQPKSTV